MKSLSELPGSPLPWSSPAGREGLLRRVGFTVQHFYRNLPLIPFPAAASEEQKGNVRHALSDFARHAGLGEIFTLDQLSPDISGCLAERFLLPPAVMRLKEKEPESLRETCIMLSGSGNRSALINAGEHLTLSGFAGPGGWAAAAEEMKRMLDGHPWSTDPEIGFLTSDPRKAGTAFRISALVHFPGFHISRQMDSLISALFSAGAAGSPHGDLTAKGGMIWVSSRATLGLSEMEILELFRQKLEKCLSMEEAAAENLFQSDRARFEDRVYRSLAILRSARLLSYQELLEFSSWIKLGTYFGLLEAGLPAVLDTLCVTENASHIAHLSAGLSEHLPPGVLRARRVRERLN